MFYSKCFRLDRSSCLKIITNQIIKYNCGILTCNVYFCLIFFNTFSMIKQLILLFAFLFLSFASLIAQTEVDERAMISFRKGLGFNAPDSTFGVNLRLRMQNRVAFNFNEELSIEDIEARVSRLRLRFDGYILGDKLTYYLQLSFSRGDQDWDNTHIPNVVRDAMVYYHFNPKFYLGFGQGKLPGNRQRIISSGQQQFYDRSNVNAQFTLDRDFGLLLITATSLLELTTILKEPFHREMAAIS